MSVSVELSVTGPAMTDPARRLFAMLGQLPDGIAADDLTVLLPDDGPAGAGVLRQLGLAFDEGNRVRVLAPIREHAAAHHQPTAPELDRMISHYCHLAAVTGREVGQVSGAGAAARLGADTGNVRRMILAAVQRRNFYLTVDAVTGMLQYARF